MVMPIADDNSDRAAFPIVNLTLIALNILVFLGPQGFGENQKFTYAFSVVPREIVTGRDIVTDDRLETDPITRRQIERPGLQATPGSVYLTLITAMFMHGGLAHLLGNMLFLWIFGDNIEDALGHIKYLIFYLVCGILASLAHVAVTYASGADPLIPCLGASGAISGVLGGYLLLFPHRRVTVIFFRVLTEVPAFVAIGMWFVFQIVSSLGVLGAGSK